MKKVEKVNIRLMELEQLHLKLNEGLEFVTENWCDLELLMDVDLEPIKNKGINSISDLCKYEKYIKEDIDKLSKLHGINSNIIFRHLVFELPLID